MNQDTPNRKFVETPKFTNTVRMVMGAVLLSCLFVCVYLPTLSQKFLHSPMLAYEYKTQQWDLKPVLLSQSTSFEHLVDLSENPLFSLGKHMPSDCVKLMLSQRKPDKWIYAACDDQEYLVSVAEIKKLMPEVTSHTSCTDPVNTAVTYGITPVSGNDNILLGYKNQLPFFLAWDMSGIFNNSDHEDIFADIHYREQLNLAFAFVVENDVLYSMYDYKSGYFQQVRVDINHDNNVDYIFKRESEAESYTQQKIEEEDVLMIPCSLEPDYKEKIMSLAVIHIQM